MYVYGYASMLRFLLALVLCLVLPVQADVSLPQEGERVVRVEPIVRDGKLYIDADVEFDVSSEMRKVAQKGVPIYFKADLVIETSRWWWFDKKIVDDQQTWRLVYNALTSQRRVCTGEMSLTA